MRRVFSCLFLFATAAVLAAAGCNDSSKDSKKSSDSSKVEDVLVLEYEEIDLFPGESKEVKVKTGKANKADVKKESGVEAKVEEKHVKVTADKEAKEGTHTVTVKGEHGKDVELKVHVKKKASE
jgi:predicted dinucleotide-utilizing enzyme